MGDAGPIGPLLDGVYDAAIDSTCWPLVLGQLTARFGSASTHLPFENVQSTCGKIISFGTDLTFAHLGRAAAQSFYFTHSAPKLVIWVR